ncbi:hypothetical protein [Vibrio harveyi]|uniref:hypothetical protein n=1 Tax=Vibrio harveyi TaxID=669 RepID=UPI00217CFA2D|nr:hypothetical protein [Vibrio harveyi]
MLFFKNRHSSHICFVDAGGSDTGGEGGDSGSDGGEGADNGMPPQDTLLGGEGGDDGEGDGGEDKGDKDTGEDDEGEDEEETGAPEKYDLSLPEGMELDEEAFEKFEPLFREMNMTNEQASKFASAFGEHVGGLVESTQNKIVEDLHTKWNSVNQEWQDSIMSDEEFGGAKVKENLNIAKSVIDRFGGEKEEIEKIRGALNETGAGNHPEVMRLLYRVGKAMQDDKLGGGTGETGSKEKNFFPNSPKLK